MWISTDDQKELTGYKLVAAHTISSPQAGPQRPAENSPPIHHPLLTPQSSLFHFSFSSCSIYNYFYHPLLKLWLPQDSCHPLTSDALGEGHTMGISLLREALGLPLGGLQGRPAHPGCANSLSSLLGKGLLLPGRAPGQLGQGLEQPGPLKGSLPMAGGQNQVTSMVPSNINHSSAHFGVLGDWLLCRGFTLCRAVT